jgi:opacity protein-like surface antigen
MRRFLAGCALAALAPVTLVAQQQQERPVRFSVAGGVTLDAGGGDGNRDSGFNVTGSAWFNRKFGQFGLRTDVSMDRWSTSQRVGAFRATGAFTAIGLTANGIYALNQNRKEGAIRPYLLGGAGLYIGRASFDTNIPGVDGSSSDTNFGLQGGGGLEFVLAGFSTFAEAKLVLVTGEGVGRWVPLTFGIKF